VNYCDGYYWGFIKTCLTDRGGGEVCVCVCGGGGGGARNQSFGSPLI
jgi:hypothetical protein